MIKRSFSLFIQFMHHDKSVSSTWIFKLLLYRDYFCIRDNSPKVMPCQLTSVYKQKALSQFLRSTVTVLS